MCTQLSLAIFIEITRGDAYYIMKIRWWTNGFESESPHSLEDVEIPVPKRFIRFVPSQDEIININHAAYSHSLNESLTAHSPSARPAGTPCSVIIGLSARGRMSPPSRPRPCVDLQLPYKHKGCSRAVRRHSSPNPLSCASPEVSKQRN